MIPDSRSRRAMLVLALVSVLALAWFVANAVRNPMDARLAKLESEINEIRVVPLFIVGPAPTDYTEVQQIVGSKGVLWRELIAPPRRAAPKDPGPNFQQILSGVSATSLEIEKNGVTVVRIVTPSSPRGTWVGVGDAIASTKVVEITPQHVVVSAMKGSKEFKYRIPRQ